MTTATKNRKNAAATAAGLAAATPAPASTLGSISLEKGAKWTDAQIFAIFNDGRAFFTKARALKKNADESSVFGSLITDHTNAILAALNAVADRLMKIQGTGPVCWNKQGFGYTPANLGRIMKDGYKVDTVMTDVNPNPETAPA